MIQRARGRQITIRSVTSLSSCSTLSEDDALASYEWNLVSANETRAGAQEVVLETGRDPRVLVIPPHTLGFAGSSYVFQFRSAFGADMSSTANATGEVSKT